LASEPVELSILLVDDEFIAGLNEQYLNRQGPTNVIAFPMREGEAADIHPELLGDVVVSVETAMREADEQSQPFEERLRFLLVHGILHLFGHDHEKSDADAELMDRETQRIMNLDTSS
jgi:rRNA maturation RNase YbeY